MSLLRALLQPLNLAALLTWAAVALSLRGGGRLDASSWILLVAFMVAMLVDDLPRLRTPPARAALLGLQGACALGLCLLHARDGAAPVLLVILSAQVAMHFGLRVGLLALLALDAALYLVLRGGGHGSPLLVTLIYAGFQAFAMLVGHYARSAERTRDALALVNADLLATRALFADSARDAERLRVARELHDVAGHKLTALLMNLRALGADPALADRAEVRVARQLAGELLGDIRGVVHALRDAQGLDLATALRALAAPLPRPRLELEIGDAVRIGDAALAEAVLRTVQEALTNAARHAEAGILRVALSRDADTHALRLAIEDDGRLRGSLREGHGLTGMRERIAAAGGTLEIGRGAGGGLRLEAVLPG